MSLRMKLVIGRRRARFFLWRRRLLVLVIAVTLAPTLLSLFYLSSYYEELNISELNPVNIQTSINEQIFAVLNDHPTREENILFAKFDTVQNSNRKTYNRSTLRPWMEKFSGVCGGHFIGYNNQFAYLEDVVVDKSFSASEKRGGEDMADVMNQEEDYEFVKYSNGFFQLTCPDFERQIKSSESTTKQPLYEFFNKSHLIEWLSVLNITESKAEKLIKTVNRVVDDTRPYFTISVQRYEYVNLYHTMTDWYNAFLMMVFFNRTAATTNILLVDAHPRGTLDSVWSRLFNSSFQLFMLPQRTYFSRMAWSIMGYNSPMTIEVIPDVNPPLYEEFRAFFLSAYGIYPKTAKIRPLDCDRLNVLFIWRHNYVAHPRNPEGRVSRQIWNEQMLLKIVQAKYPKFRIRGEQIEKFDMSTQLHLIVSTDILVGMHGAGLTLALFLPHQRAGLIELRPQYSTSTGEHFAAIAHWRKLVYEVWTNDNVRRDYPGQGTIVPTDVITELISNVARKLCEQNSPPN